MATAEYLTTNGETFPDIRDSVRRLCTKFSGEYWREHDRERAYPKKFVAALTEAGYLAALIPESYGGSGLGVREASAIMEEIHRAGCNGGACHAQMYTMGTILRHGSPWHSGDAVGIGIDLKSGKAFFTHNGVFKGFASLDYALPADMDYYVSVSVDGADVTDVTVRESLCLLVRVTFFLRAWQGT